MKRIAVIWLWVSGVLGLCACGTFADLDSLEFGGDVGAEAGDVSRDDGPSDVADGGNIDVPLDDGVGDLDVPPGDSEDGDAVDGGDDADADADAGGVRAVRVFAGPLAQHTCASYSGGTHYCWGDNLSGQIGDGARVLQDAEPRLVTGVSGVSVFASGTRHTCVVQEPDGEVLCWGDNRSYQLGPGAGVAEVTSEPSSAIDGASTVVAGESHSCVIQAGRVRCWGSNGWGQLGVSLDISVAQSPQLAVATARDALYVAAGANFNCAQVSGDELGGVVCWGDNREGQLGARADDGPCGGEPCSPVPLVVRLWSGDPGSSWAPGIAAGAAHACGRRDGGDRNFPQCWGANDGGQLAQFDTETYDGPVDVVWPGDVTDALGLGADFTCLAQTNSPLLECYGRSDRGQLVELGFDQPPEFVGLSSGVAHTCGWTASGIVSCWGDNGSFQLGSDTVEFQSQLLPLGELRLSAVAAGSVHNCGRDEDGAMWCWGDNRWGQLGRGDPILRLAPTEIDDVEGGWSQFAGAAGHACGLADGRLYCWGDSVEGEIGRRAGDPSTNPTPVFDPAPSRLDKVAVAGRSSCALASRGEVRCWGSNACGQLAVPLDTESRAMPAAVVAPDLPLFSDIAVGAQHVCAVARGDGAVWCWGSNAQGQLGVREVSEEACNGSDYTPAALPTFFGASEVAAGVTHTCVNVGGVVWCWGDNGDGQLGPSPGLDGAPAMVGDLVADVEQLACGGAHCCVLHATGTLSCWGNNAYGQLGGVGGEGGVPVAVPGLTDVTWVAAGWEHTCAVAGGQLWCWGRNQFGQVGDGTQVDRDVPRPVSP